MRQDPESCTLDSLADDDLSFRLPSREAAPRARGGFPRLLAVSLVAVLALVPMTVFGGGPEGAPGESVGVALAEGNTTRKPAAASNPVLVELFTSQGCSSCPPADRLLTRLAAEEGDVVALSFHVDYWDYIGWQDPFASPAWTERQRIYGRALAQDSVYTPEVVVDGRRHVVGSRENLVLEEIQRARRRASVARVQVRQVLSLAESEEAWAAAQNTLVIEASAELLAGRPGGSPGPLALEVAVFENDLETEVSAGENRRRTLHNDRVVRWLGTAVALDPPSPHQATGGRGQVRVPLEDGWRRSRLGVAVFLQDPASRAVYGAAILEPEELVIGEVSGRS